MPIFIAILIAILEGGRMLMLNQTMRAATSTSARSAAITGNSTNADFLILQSARRSTVARIPASSIDKIIVFKATGSTSSVPPGCLSGPINGTCNYYTGNDFTLVESDLSTCTAPSKARFWCPSSRKYAATATEGNGPPDWIGVYIEAEVPLLTGMFGSVITLKDTQITKIEATAIA